MLIGIVETPVSVVIVSVLGFSRVFKVGLACSESACNGLSFGATLGRGG